MRLFLLIVCCITATAIHALVNDPPIQLVPLDSIVAGDPFIFKDLKSGLYIMVGTTRPKGCLWISSDLSMWQGPVKYLNWDDSSWIGTSPSIWAPEIHEYNGNYYCFVTFTNKKKTHGEVNGRKLPYRNTYILESDNPMGPYKEFCSNIFLDSTKCIIDGTLWVEPDGTPYMVYSYEWIQAVDGRIEAVKLDKKLKNKNGYPLELFRASNGKWKNNQVAEAPFLFRTKSGRLGMLWSTWSSIGYTQGVAYSESGKIIGPWIQESEPLTPCGFGHGMLFRTFEGKLLLVCHGWRHDKNGRRTTRFPVLYDVEDSDKLILTNRYIPKI